ncbi:response regulator [Limnohabitans sp. Bal53]|uniref:response regulator n=1 Tax=Limnohabitans sp. Bal53 TaxID=1977910 RepID=UPI001304E293|nr:response regulator [Limnohabitans sp. Bal53]
MKYLLLPVYWIRQALQRWPLWWLGLLLVGICLWVVLYTYQASERMVRQYATESAQAHAVSLTQFRNFYTDQIVPRAMEAGLHVTHDYKNRKNTLPLPATLTLDLGHYLSKVDGGTQVRLYSEKPFPWREQERELDDFQRQALQHLKEKPDVPFVREEILNGERVLRFAQADRMTLRCVACHNSYPSSPRTDWKTGDVRGALEVVLPVSQWQTTSTGILNRTFVVLLALLFLGLLLVWLTVRRFRQALLTSRKLATERRAAIEQLNEEINERKQIERQMRLSESKLQSIFRSVPEAIVVTDAEGQIVQCNNATEAIFGYTLEELKGQKVDMLMRAEDGQRHDHYMQGYQRTGGNKIINQPRVLHGRRKDGQLFSLRLTISEMRVDDEVHFVGVMQDFTTIENAQRMLIEAKEKAEQDNRMRGEFLANMSHEIRTPMNGIVGMTELAMDTQDKVAQKEYLTLARDSANHLLHIINQILDFSKIEARALELELLKVSPGQLIHDTSRSLEQLARVKGIDLQVDIASAVPEWAWMDPVRMRQVLTNLIGNAIKFTEVGAVTVAAQAVPGHDAEHCVLRISITDTGIGFDPSRTAALFSPFTQGDGSVTRSFGGTGLGLAITRRLVHLMGGEISANAQPDLGACFTVTLPVEKTSLDANDQSAAAAQSSDLSESPRYQKLISVLLVEDHDINRKLAEIMLQRMGYRYVSACDGLQALDVLEKDRFDVVLMDVMMPVMDGITALKLLREREGERGQRTRVLMVTAHAMTGDRERFLGAGADGYVSKPMSQAALQKEIERVLNVPHADEDEAPN